MRTALTIEVTHQYYLDGILLARMTHGMFEVMQARPTNRQALALAHLMVTYSGFKSEAGSRFQEEAEVMLEVSDSPF